jgi:hypothetical protein
MESHLNFLLAGSRVPDLVFRGRNLIPVFRGGNEDSYGGGAEKVSAKIAKEFRGG